MQNRIIGIENKTKSPKCLSRGRNSAAEKFPLVCVRLPLRTAEGLELGYRPPTDLTLNPLGTREMELRHTPFSGTMGLEEFLSNVP